MDLFLIIGIIIGAFHTGWVCREIYAKHVVKKMHDEMSDHLSEIQEQFKENVIPMRVEKHNSEYFLYNTTNQAFICQGATKDELRERFNVAYPQKKGVILEGTDLWREVNDK